MGQYKDALDKIDNSVCIAYNCNNNAIFNKDDIEHCDCKDAEEYCDAFEKVLEAVKFKEFFEELKKATEIIVYWHQDGHIHLRKDMDNKFPIHKVEYDKDDNTFLLYYKLINHDFNDTYICDLTIDISLYKYADAEESMGFVFNEEQLNELLEQEEE